MPDSYLNGSFPIQGNQPLYLSIDASISTYRATILNSALEVIWVEQVEIDEELAQFSFVLTFLSIHSVQRLTKEEE